MKTFKITKHLQAVCDSQNTRYGFRHIANLLRDGYEIETAKCCYYNRTWECYEFESVLNGLYSKAQNGLTKYESQAFNKMIKNGGKREAARFSSFSKTIAMVSKMGEVLTDSQKAANDWKKRMLTAGLEKQGLDFPADWGTLTEDEKQARLDGAIAQL